MMGRCGYARRTLPIGSRRSPVHVRRRFEPFSVYCARFEQSPHLLVGDFNALVAGDPVGGPPPGVRKTGDALPDAPRRTLRQLFDAGYVDCFRTLHPQLPGYTCSADHPWLRLDDAFAEPTLARRLVQCEVNRSNLARRASDHLPLVVRYA
jgi:exonuclease III